MVPPSEIAIVNRDGRKFWARFTGLFNSREQTYRYRVLIPTLTAESTVVLDFDADVIRMHLRTGKAIRIIPP